MSYTISGTAIVRPGTTRVAGIAIFEGQTVSSISYTEAPGLRWETNQTQSYIELSCTNITSESIQVTYDISFTAPDA